MRLQNRENPYGFFTSGINQPTETHFQLGYAAPAGLIKKVMVDRAVVSFCFRNVCESRSGNWHRQDKDGIHIERYAARRWYPFNEYKYFG